MNADQLSASSLDAAFPRFAPFMVPVPLIGGGMNFVWRVRCASGTAVVKRAPPYVATVPDLTLGSRRLLFEAKALRLFDGGPLARVAHDAARAPRLLGFDRTEWLLLVEDVGSGPDLSTALSSPDVFRELGMFIGRVHAQTLRQKHIARRFANIDVQRARLASQYAKVGSFAHRSGAEDAAELGSAALNLGRRLLKQGRCLTMGDLWPASVLIREPGLRFIDWEFAHFGNPAQDVAHLLAHIVMLGAQRNEVSIAERAAAAFGSAYRDATKEKFESLWDEDVQRDAGLHFGSELLARVWGPFYSTGPLASLDPLGATCKDVTAQGLNALRRPLEVPALRLIA